MQTKGATHSSGGEATRLVIHGNRERALKAVGLEE
jgi:hypothetical protein